MTLELKVYHDCDLPKIASKTLTQTYKKPWYKGGGTYTTEEIIQDTRYYKFTCSDCGSVWVWDLSMSLCGPRLYVWRGIERTSEWKTVAEDG